MLKCFWQSCGGLQTGMLCCFMAIHALAALAQLLCADAMQKETAKVLLSTDAECYVFEVDQHPHHYSGLAVAAVVVAQ